MHGYIERKHHLGTILEKFKYYPVTVLLGPRQVGKSTLAKAIQDRVKKALYLDLQNPKDLLLLEDPFALFERNPDTLIILDEIQKAPEFFSVLRSIIDQNRTNGRVLVLGSASRDLIKQSSETLAGRICYLEITPFFRREIRPLLDFRQHWQRGGFPLGLLAENDSTSLDWRKNYIQTFLERDIPQLGFANLPSPMMSRFWQMLAHNHGQFLNQAQLAQSLGVSSPSVKKYLSILEQLFVIRQLEPYAGNLKKRLVKSPRIYLRDSGLLHCLLDIESERDLMGHPVCGSSYEGFVMENIISLFPEWRPSFLRTSNGAEVDLVLQKGRKLKFFEMKLNSTPKASRGLHQMIEELHPEKTFVIAPVKSSFQVNKVTYISLDEFIEEHIQLP